MKVPLLDLKAQYKSIHKDVQAVMVDVCKSQYFIGGPHLESLEKKVARYCGVAHAVGVSSGTDALLLALMALDIGPGDGVLTTPYTFFATGGSIARLGATPVFVDIDPVSFNMDPAACRKTLENIPPRFRKLKMKALLPVHLYGQVAEMETFRDLAREYNLHIVEDAAQAIGSQYMMDGEKKRAGSMGDAGCFSFFPSKNLGGFGDGGMVVTHDEPLANKMRDLRNHGANPKYYHKMIGGNFRLDALQAAVLAVKLKHLESWHAARRRNAAYYNKAFKKAGVLTPVPVHKGMKLKNYHIYNQYILRLPCRDDMRQKLLSSDIGCEIYYPVPLHSQDCFRYLKYKKGDFPESEKAAMETLALPIYPELTTRMQDCVIRTILKNLKT